MIDIITPLIGLILGCGNSFENLKIVIGPSQYDILGNLIQAAHATTYEIFLQNILDFLIIALSVFTMVYVIGRAKAKAEELVAKKQQEKPKTAVIEEPKPSVEDIHQDIKTLLKKNLTK